MMLPHPTHYYEVFTNILILRPLGLKQKGPFACGRSCCHSFPVVWPGVSLRWSTGCLRRMFQFFLIMGFLSFSSHTPPEIVNILSLNVPTFDNFVFFSIVSFPYPFFIWPHLRSYVGGGSYMGAGQNTKALKYSLVRKSSLMGGYWYIRDRSYSYSSSRCNSYSYSHNYSYYSLLHLLQMPEDSLIYNCIFVSALCQ